MKAKPEVIEAANAALHAEITFHEVIHGWEKVAKRYGYKGLRRFFDSHHEKSRDRRRCLQMMLAAWDAPLRIALDAATIDPTTRWTDVFRDLLSRATALAAAYHAAYRIAEDADMSTAADAFCELQESAEKLVVRLEAVARQLKEIGLGPWLGEHL